MSPWLEAVPARPSPPPRGLAGVFQSTKKLFLSERKGWGRSRALEFIRRNAANGLSVANLVAGLSSILCSLNRQHHHSCWLLLVGFLLDLADGAVARRLNACSALGAKLDDFADFTTFGLATALLLQPQGVLSAALALAYVLAVFTRLCFFSSGIPFTYRGVPCPYASSLLAGTFLLSGGNAALLQVTAGIMILFMLDRGCYPHDKVLESQLWKKVVYAGGVAAVLFSPATVASIYCLAWSMSYIVFPFAIWSCKAQPLPNTY
ncbi:transmembrane protein 269 isoform X1 [Neopsephotus bourkii]|uniref:transmembrane protein 269 isoform X1 n=1 Tax=Neopsephotus bourkii TaxID=309878 RepID=UPI002AA4FFA2|nr:transmembrane protein 269 isoform X1 [Neopsephotus bourkii]XP_061235539.1 transmembrane protein 269 isoform X1 [Neopsephotus bourkii]XP_061235540.1 transmembrane protein 269 isoform X1 [Neopsephotus bourkii]